MICKNFFWVTPLLVCLFFCSCSTIEKEFEEQIITSQPVFPSEKNVKENKEDQVAYVDYLETMPVYEAQLAQNNPIEGIQVWDPVEPLNRAIFNFNDFVIQWVITPVGTVYSFIIPRPAQKRINNVYNNVLMPGKLVNNLLQWKPLEASSVLTRFLLNTTIGIGGIFDFADHTGVSFLKRPPNQTFAKTLGHWGVPAGPYLVIPFLGPSDLRGGVGQIVDSQMNVFTYYLPEVGIFFRVNGIVYFLPLYYQTKGRSEDPYTNLRDFSRLQMRGQLALEEHTPEQETKKVIYPQDKGILQTLGYLEYVSKVDYGFTKNAKTGEIRFKGQQKPIHYNAWIQEENAPLVFILPGFGGDFDSGLCNKVAKEFYDKKYSVVATSSIFSEDFASGFKDLGKPGLITRDTEHLYLILKRILQTLHKKYPGRISKVSLVGYSMGGFFTSFIAAKEQELQDPIFENYVSVHSPGNLTYALSTIDKYLFDSYKNLNEEERSLRQLKSIGTIFSKVSGGGPNVWNTPYAITGEDARFLIGFSYIRSLFPWVDNEPIVSFSGYCRNLLLPAYQKKSGSLNQDLVKNFGYNSSYWKIQNTLRSHNRLYLFVNENDPLLDKNSLELLKKIVPENRLFLSEEGGHLGNLIEIQDKVIRTVRRPYVKIR